MREKILFTLPIVVAVAAIVVVIFQQVGISGINKRLDRRLKTLKIHLDRSVKDLREEMSEDERPSLAGRLRDFDSRLTSLERKLGQGAKTAVIPATAPPKVANPDAASGLRKEFERLRDMVDALLREEALNTRAGRKRLTEIVTKAYETARHTRRKRWRTIRDEAVKDRLTEFADKANLSDGQLKELRGLIEGERKKRRRIFRAMRERKKPLRNARKEFRALRKQTNQKAKDLLDEEQYGLYKKEFRRRRGRRGRW